MTLGDKEPQMMLVSWSSVSHLVLGMQPPLRRVCFPTDIALEKTQF